MKLLLINYVVFQVGWFACVWGAAANLPWLGLVFVACAVSWHLLWARRPGTEAIWLLSCGLAGLVFDSALLWTGWVSYPNGAWLPALAPYWMIAMWVLFGTTLNVSMAWMRGRPWLGLLFGAIGGPASYLAGESLGAMSLLQPAAALTALALGWGTVLPLLFRLAARLDGFAKPRPPDFVQSCWRDDPASGHV